MRTSIAFRVAAGLALATGLTAGGVSAAYALDLPVGGDPDIPADCASVAGDPVALQNCMDELAAGGSGGDTSTGGDTSDDGATGGGSTGGDSSGGSTGGDSTGGTETGSSGGDASGSGSDTTGGGQTGGNEVGGGTVTAPPAAPPATVPAPQPSQQPAPATGGSPSTGSSGSSKPSGGSSSGTSTASSGSSASSSSSSSDTVVTAAPAVPVAPAGPALTQAQSKAAGAAIEEVRSTLPTTVEPNTRLLAGNTASQGSLIPSPDDSGLLALIIAMGALSAACAVAAGVLRRRSRPRHLG